MHFKKKMQKMFLQFLNAGPENLNKISGWHKTHTSINKILNNMIKGKGMFSYIARVQSVGSLKAHYTSSPLPDRPVHSGTNSTSLGRILATQQLRSKAIHSHFHRCLYTQVLIYTAEWTGAAWSERKWPNLETSKGCIRTRVL